MNIDAKKLDFGLDVGSTTVKGVLLDGDEIIWKDYRRHNSHQPETVKELLDDVVKEYSHAEIQISITGSGSRSIAPLIDANFVQEVNAVTIAVETLHPEVNSVVELGGQDAKVIIWQGEGKKRSTLTYMNDKCAGGTGSTVDKIMSKVGLTQEEAAEIEADGKQLHNVAAKCGVFAETDVVGLLKAGINKEEIFISLCNAIVKQNLEVLVRGNVLRDKVLLLGGPNKFIKALAPIWREQIKATWEIHGYTPSSDNLEEIIYSPDDSHYFAAIGAVLFHRKNGGIAEQNYKKYDSQKLVDYITHGRLQKLEEEGRSMDGLVSDESELEAFRKKYEIPQFKNKDFETGTVVDGWLGIDGGSTSTKMVIVDKNKVPFYKDYKLSTGNPIDDAKELFATLGEWVSKQGITLTIKGSGATGYAAEILTNAFNLDTKVVETVAHMKSAVTLYGDVDVICDVGGQDIKVLFLKNGRVTDFKLNTQCSAGNGYFLQGMAEQFNVPIEEYADKAFTAIKAPAFNYGCAVFMEQDRVNFQQAGWTKEEMMAGLALVLPLNIWNYVVQESNLARLGKNFVLQGGTQKNLAAAKAQVDFIKSRVPGAEVHVHKYADIGGAIGAAIEALDIGIDESSFIGIDDASKVTFTSRNDESTVCHFCTNNCRRTFIDITSENGRAVRFISGYACEKGSVEDKDEMLKNYKALNAKISKTHNLVDWASKRAFSSFDFEELPAHGTKIDKEEFYPVDGLHHFSKEMRKRPFQRSDKEAIAFRKTKIVGIPRLLNQFYYTPFFSTYFRTLGVDKVVFSDLTSEKLWSEGNKFGSIDPCFPAKVAPAHIYNLLNKDITDICFPIITQLESTVQNNLENTACTIQMGTPEVVEAAFTRGRNYFEEKNIDYWDPAFRMDRPVEVEGELYEYFKDRLQITRDENAWAIKQANQAQKQYLEEQRELFEEAMNELIDEDKIGLLLIGHPYHHDPGLNHGIPEEFRKLGYPVFTIESLPDSDEFLAPLFPEAVDKNGYFEIGDVWERNFNRNTNHKIWAAKVAARHPNLAVIDLSSFKCGHDAPTYAYVSQILDATGTPHFMFHDIDQNKPGASLKIRIETIDYFLKKEHEKLAHIGREVTNG